MPISTTRDEPPTLNMTSMIDVVFLIIIFFMVATKFDELDRSIGLQLPEVAEAPAAAQKSKQVVTVYRDGQFALDGENVSLNELTQRLATARSQYQDLGILIRGDAASSFQQVADAMSACKRAGISELGISVRLASRAR